MGECDRGRVRRLPESGAARRVEPYLDALVLARGILEPASRASAAAFGPALFALIHEGVHLSGVTDEWAADCTALSDTWSVAWIYFAVRQPELSRVHEFALRAHLAQPAEYVRAGSC